MHLTDKGLWYRHLISAANLAVFPRIWTCFFPNVRDFLKTFGLLVFRLVPFIICLFLGLIFAGSVLQIAFHILWNFLGFYFLQNAIWTCFCAHLLILEVFFRFARFLFRLCLLFVSTLLAFLFKFLVKSILGRVARCVL